MDYNVVSKKEKAKRYAEERNRFHFQSFTVSMDGDNNSHQIQYESGKWQCDCEFFRSRGLCSHTMALGFFLEGMIVSEPVVS